MFNHATYCLKLMKLSVKECFDHTPALIFLSNELVPQFFGFCWVHYRFAFRHPRSSVAQLTGFTCLSDGIKIWFDDCSFFLKKVKSKFDPITIGGDLHYRQILQSRRRILLIIYAGLIFPECHISLSKI